MRIGVIPIPEALLVFSETFYYQFDASGGVGYEDQVEVIRVGLEGLKDTQTDIFYSFGRGLRCSRCRVRVAVKRGGKILRKKVEGRLGIQRSAGMVEIHVPCDSNKSCSTCIQKCCTF